MCDCVEYERCDRCNSKQLPGDMFYLECGDLVCEYCYDNAREDGEELG